MAIFFALLAFFGWGVGILFEAIVARKLESYSYLFWGFVLSLVITSFYAPFVLTDLKGLSLGVFVLNLSLAILWIVGIVTYLQGLKVGNPTLVAAISSSFPAVIVVLSVIFLKEVISVGQGLAIAVILAGLLLSSFSLKDLSRKTLFNDRGVLLALLTMLSWGVTFTFIKIPINQIGWFWPTYIVFCFAPLIFLFMKATKRKLHFPTKAIWAPLILSVVLVRVAEYAYNLGISQGLVSIVAPIAGANPVLFIPLAYFVFREPLTRQQSLGIALTVAGTVTLSFLSV